MTKKETFKWIVQIIASVATAILTAMGTTSFWGTRQRKAFWKVIFQNALYLVFMLCWGVTIC